MKSSQDDYYQKTRQDYVPYGGKISGLSAIFIEKFGPELTLHGLSKVELTQDQKILDIHTIHFWRKEVHY